MSFCSKCGASIADQAEFCQSCGQRTGANAGTSSASAGVKVAAWPERFFGPVCYAVGWITGVMMFSVSLSMPAQDPRRSFIRFHAGQSIVVFGGLSIVYVILSSLAIPIILMALMALGFALWILLMFKSSQGENYKLPIAGDLVDKYFK